MNQYFVYILQCADGSYYTGVTNDLKNRLYEHQKGVCGEKSYTYKRRPVKLVFHEFFYDINDAIAFEKQVKGWSRAKKEVLIVGNWEGLKALSRGDSKIPRTTLRPAQGDNPPSGA